MRSRVTEAVIALDRGREKVIRVEDIRVPLAACFGSYEALTNEELDEMITDLLAEAGRRA